MSKISSDFERFMIANFPDDYRRATASDVKEDVINSIYSKLEDEYQKWCRVPEWIKAEYRDDLPDEVLNGSKSVRQFIKEEEQENQNIQKQVQETTDYGVSLLAAGYAAESVSILLTNRNERARLYEEAGGGPMSEEMMQKWRQTRERDRQVILKDWKENQPHKYIVHLAKQLNRVSRRESLAKDDNERVAIEMRKEALREELVRMTRKLKNEEVRANFIDYMRGKRQQACLSMLRPEVLEMFTGILAESGLKLQATAGSVDKEFKLDKDSLVYDLKLQYEKEKGAVGKKLESYNINDKKSKDSGAKTIKEVDVSGLSQELINMHRAVSTRQRA